MYMTKSEIQIDANMKVEPAALRGWCFMCKRRLPEKTMIGASLCPEPCQGFAQRNYELRNVSEGRLRAAVQAFDVLLGWRRIPFGLEDFVRAATMWGIPMSKRQARVLAEFLEADGFVLSNAEGLFLVNEWCCEERPASLDIDA